jgi:catecholate siderophore receptor
LFGVEFIDTASDQDRFNTYFDTSESDKETFSISVGLPLALVGGRGTNSEGQATVNDFTLKLNDDTHVEIEARSMYLQDEIQLSEKFIAIVGARYDKFDIEVDNVKSADIRNRKDNEVSPRAGLIYKPQENTSIYLSYSESFLPRSGEQFANINGDKNQLDPDTFENLELGIKWNVNEALSLSASVFEIDKKSPQVADSDPSTLDVIESSIDGFEVQIQGQLNAKWSINASYGYLDGEQVNRSGNTGLRPRELPENTISLWTSYQLTPKFGLGLGASYQDESFINNSNSATLPSYTRIDAAAYYEVSEDLMLQLHVENVSDRDYFPNSHSTHQASVGEEVNARLSLQWAL